MPFKDAYVSDIIFFSHYYIKVSTQKLIYKFLSIIIMNKLATSVGQILKACELLPIIKDY